MSHREFRGHHTYPHHITQCPARSDRQAVEYGVPGALQAFSPVTARRFRVTVTEVFAYGAGAGLIPDETEVLEAGTAATSHVVQRPSPAGNGLNSAVTTRQVRLRFLGTTDGKGAMVDEVALHQPLAPQAAGPGEPGPAVSLQGEREPRANGSPHAGRRLATGLGTSSGQGDERVWRECSCGFRQEICHFVNCVAYDEAPLETGEDGRAALEIIFVAYESAGTGRRVELRFTPPEGKRPIGLWVR